MFGDWCRSRRSNASGTSEKNSKNGIAIENSKSNANNEFEDKAIQVQSLEGKKELSQFTFSNFPFY